MSEMGEDLKAWNEEIKKFKRVRQEDAKDMIYDWAKGTTFEVYEVQPHQIRISSHKKSIDIYPQSLKYHKIGSNKRGKIYSINSLIPFLSKCFQYD